MRLGLVLLLLLSVPALGGPPRPVTTDEIRAMVAKAGNAKDHGGAATVVVLDESDVIVQPSGLATTRNTWVEKILTDAGARANAVLRERFDPNTNRVRIDAVRIHRKDGTVEDVDVSGVVTALTPQRMIFWGGKQHLLSLPRPEPGDTIEIRSRRIGFNIAYLEGPGAELSGDGLQPPMPGHWYEVVRFEGNRPILRMRYSVHMPKTIPLQFAVYNGPVRNGPLRSSLWFDGDRHVYSFEAENVPAMKREPRMAPRDDCVTKVVLATLPDWESKSRWFHRVNDGQFDADDAIRAEVARITKGLTDIDDKIAACHHWVSDNIRYVGTSRGPAEGYTLHRGIETFHDRAGVCKDIAGMLITMLRVLELDAYPALTMAGPRVEPIPADQFNHTVCVLRNADGTFRVLDPTWCPVSREEWSSREAEQGLVYGTPEGQGLTLSPFYEPEYNGHRVRSDARLDEAGTLTTTLSLDLKGYADTYFRRSRDRHHPTRRREAVEEALGLAPGARLVSMTSTPPRDYSRDTSAKLEVAAKGYAAVAGDLAMFRLPLLRHPFGRWLMPDLLDAPGPKQRRYGLRLRATRLVRYEETIALPEGWTITSRPEDRKLESPAADLLFETRVEGAKLTVVFELRAKKHLIPPDEYEGFRKAIEAMRAIAGEWVVCRKGGGK